MGKHLKSILVVLGIFVLVIFIVDKLLWNPPASQSLTYSQFWTKVQAHQVKQVTINGREIAGQLNDQGQTHFTTTTPDDKDLLPALRSNAVEITAVNNQSTPLLGYVFQ